MIMDILSVKSDENVSVLVSPWLMLLSRSAMFFLAQALFALAYLALGSGTAWYEAARWWPMFAVLANIGSVLLLARLTRVEGGRYFDLLRFSRARLKRDLLWRLGMYLPFALFIGLALKLRPSLLPYFAIIHALMDISTLAVYWMV